MEDVFGQTTRIEFFDAESDPPLADELPSLPTCPRHRRPVELV